MITIDRPVRATIADDLAVLLGKDVQKKYPQWSDEYCRRGVDQMAGFLVSCAATTAPLAPSQIVDEFWHAFVLRTLPYAQFCDQLGRFIHHNPDDGEASDVGTDGDAVRAATLAAISEAGFTADPDFWPAQNGQCSQCHAGCNDSPK
jgi:hypothetical protein